jgi:hypothetical protein
MSAYLEGFLAPTAPLDIQRKRSAAKVSFSNLKAVWKCKEVSETPDSPAATNHSVENLIPPRGILDTSKVEKVKHPLYTSIVFITLRVPQGKVTELITELMSDGLNILCSEDKTVCFLHPDDFGQQVKKRADMPEKFQKIYKN